MIEFTSLTQLVAGVVPSTWIPSSSCHHLDEFLEINVFLSSKWTVVRVSHATLQTLALSSCQSWGAASLPAYSVLWTLEALAYWFMCPLGYSPPFHWPLSSSSASLYHLSLSILPPQDHQMLVSHSLAAWHVDRWNVIQSNVARGKNKRTTLETTHSLERQF